MDHERKIAQAELLQFSHTAFYPFVDYIIAFLFAQGKHTMFTVKNFYDKVEASYEFTYTEN